MQPVKRFIIFILIIVTLLAIQACSERIIYDKAIIDIDPGRFTWLIVIENHKLIRAGAGEIHISFNPDIANPRIHFKHTNWALGESTDYKLIFKDTNQYREYVKETQ